MASASEFQSQDRVLFFFGQTLIHFTSPCSKGLKHAVVYNLLFLEGWKTITMVSHNRDLPALLIEHDGVAIGDVAYPIGYVVVPFHPIIWGYRGPTINMRYQTINSVFFLFG